MMGYGDCGNDSNGRPIGYNFSATCDHPGCTAAIHRGMAHACGGDHGENDYSCEGYFCPEHLICVEIRQQHVQGASPHVSICPACHDKAEAAKLLVDEDDEDEATGHVQGSEAPS